MSQGGDTRFRKGRSGNPKGRPRRARRATPATASAFDIVFDQILTVTQNGVERELTVDEALQWQTYQAALKGQRLAIRSVLRMIEKREKALAKLRPPEPTRPAMEFEFVADNAEVAMGILGISNCPPDADPEHPDHSRQVKLETWATQAALSRPHHRRYGDNQIDAIKHSTLEPERLKWPRGARA